MKHMLRYSLLLLVLFPALSWAQNSPVIKINGNQVSADPVTGIKLPFWLKATETLEAFQDVHGISVIEFDIVGNKMDYVRTLTVTTLDAVPANKTWKVESIYFTNSSGGVKSWSTIGNAGTSPTTNFIGTSDVQPVIFKANNLEGMRMSTALNVGIGTTNPTAKLEVAGQIKITGGSPGANKILISDASGLGSWGTMADAGAMNGTGTVNFVTKWTTAGVALGNSTIFDNGTSIGIGTAGPSTSAKVEISSTTQGFAMPRMTSAQRKAIASPIAGLQVYDTDLQGFYFYNGTKWDCVSTPAGTVTYFASSAPPSGYLECNGQAVSRTQYAELYAAIATIYGAGNGSTTFNLPDLRGEFIRGFDNSRGADPGRGMATFQAQDFKSFSMSSYQTGAYSHGPVYFAKTGNTGNIFAGEWTGPANALSLQWDGSEIRPRNVALLPCIKY